MLDANVFIEAKKRYYAFGICPGFWDSLCWCHQQSSVYSVDRVKDELTAYADELAEWATSSVSPAAFVDTTDAATVQAYAEAMRWVQAEPHYLQTARAEFADKADAWIIAAAKARGMILVTHEVSEPARRNRVKIPDVCNGLGIEWMDSFTMLSELRTQFVWNPPLP
ncbi:MAG: DUF4411 family protein [Armatimonadetes bacterium]|nr:DUF4411 family protein [Armatimonadota bacterium]